MVYVINDEHLTRRKLVTIDGSKVTSETGIPLGLNINLPNVKAAGADVRLAKLDGTPLAREIECKDVPNTDDVTIWYKWDTTAAQNDQFYVYWGNSNLTEPAEDSSYGREAVWDANYVFVSHMADLTSTTILDSTSFSKTYTKLSTGNPVEYDAPYGKSQDFSSDYISTGDSADFDFTDFTFESYHYKDTDTTGSIMSKFYDGSARSWEFDDNTVSDFMDSYVNAAGTPHVTSAVDSAPEQNWHYTAIRHDDSSTSQWYVNGSSSGAAVDIGAVNFNSAGVKIGDREHATSRVYFDGKIAELRLSNILRTANYVATISNNLKNPTATGTTPFYLSFSPAQHQRRIPFFMG